MQGRPKIILQVVGAMNIGGVETLLLNSLKESDHKKYRHVFLCYLKGNYDYESRVEELGGKIVRIPDNRVKNPIKFVMDIQRVIKNEGVDVIHSHVDFSSGYALWAAKNAGVRNRIAHAHNTSGTRSRNTAKNIWFKILKYAMNHMATKRVACGMDAGQFMFGKNTYSIIPNGIHIERFEFNPMKKEKIRKDLSIGKDEAVILHAGRYEAAKNHNFLIDVFKSYHELNNSSKLILLGNGSLYSEIKDKVQELGLEGAVYMLGKKMNPEDYLSAADIFAMPSLYEGMPLSLIEAQANGLPCIVSDTIDRTANYGGIYFYPLSKTADKWAQHIGSIDFKRRRPSQALVETYDIKYVVALLQELYEG